MDKANAKMSSTRDVADLTATIAANEPLIQESTEEVADLGKHIASKQGELGLATRERDSQHAEFALAAKELLDAVGETERAPVPQDDPSDINNSKKVKDRVFDTMSSEEEEGAEHP